MPHQKRTIGLSSRFVPTSKALLVACLYRFQASLKAVGGACVSSVRLWVGNIATHNKINPSGRSTTKSLASLNLLHSGFEGSAYLPLLAHRQVILTIRAFPFATLYLLWLALFRSSGCILAWVKIDCNPLAQINVIPHNARHELIQRTIRG
jgi:hypothetical protein